MRVGVLTLAVAGLHMAFGSARFSVEFGTVTVLFLVFGFLASFIQDVKEILK